MNHQLKPIFIREQIIKSIREFFYQKEFHEVAIPVLNTSLPLEQNIYPFKTTWTNIKGNKDFYLSTSPEAYLKKMIVKGMRNCFGIGHSFRNMEGAGPLHNPEFLMLEWYRENSTYEDIMRDTRDLILSIHKAIYKSTSCKERRDWINFNAEWKVLSMVDLFKKYAKLDLEEIIDDKKIIITVQKKGYKVRNATWEQIYNQIFLNEIEPHLPKEPFFLIEYPAKISPLCAKRKDKPYLAERFELYINGIEIANGNTENTDYKSVHREFKIESEMRKKAGLISPPIDMEFINALKKMQGKSYAGIGMGIDRLTVVLGEIDDIGELVMSSRT